MYKQYTLEVEKNDRIFLERDSTGIFEEVTHNEFYAIINGKQTDYILNAVLARLEDIVYHYDVIFVNVTGSTLAELAKLHKRLCDEI